MKTRSFRLSELQDAFLAEIRGSDSGFSLKINPISSLAPKECIDIYSKGYFARLTEALGETFESIWWVLGDEDFFELTTQYIKENVSEEFDLSDYGEGFPDFLASLRRNSEIPFLQDLGRFEWAFKNIFHKRSRDFRQVEWSSGIENARLILSDSAVLLTSRFSVYEIWKRRAQPIETLNDVDWSRAEHLVLFKANSQVNIRIVASDAFMVIRDLASGKTLESSIDGLITDYKDISPDRVQSIFATVSTLGIFSIEEERIIKKDINDR